MTCFQPSASALWLVRSESFRSTRATEAVEKMWLASFTPPDNESKPYQIAKTNLHCCDSREDFICEILKEVFAYLKSAKLVERQHQGKENGIRTKYLWRHVQVRLWINVFLCRQFHIILFLTFPVLHLSSQGILIIFSPLSWASCSNSVASRFRVEHTIL